MERTLALFLPALVEEGGSPAIIQAIERAGMRVVVDKFVTLTSKVGSPPLLFLFFTFVSISHCPPLCLSLTVPLCLSLSPMPPSHFFFLFF